MHNNSQPFKQSGLPHPHRRTVLRAAGLASLGLAASSSLAGADEDTDEGNGKASHKEINTCTVIDEPGDYEIVGDISPDGTDRSACVEIRSDGVALHGNDHTIDGTGLDSCIAIDHGRRGEEESLDPIIEDVTVRGAGVGVSSRFSGFNGVYRNITARENDSGFRFLVGGGQLTNCRIEENNTGILLLGEQAVWEMGGEIVAEKCTIGSNASHGIWGGSFSRTGIVSSRIIENGIGVGTSPMAYGSTLHSCHICRNEHYGIEAGSSPGDDPELWDDPNRDFPFEPSREGTVIAIENYWGASNGPSSFGNPNEPFTDPETGRTADGDGDAISQGLDPGISNVRFDPFSSATFSNIGST